MFASVTIAFALALNGWTLAAEQAAVPFQRDAAVKHLGYDPETAMIDCNTNKHSLASVARGGPGKSEEESVVLHLKASGELSAEHVACPNATSEHIAQFVTPDEVLSGSVCRAAAAGAAGEITEHVSELINTDHPDVVAAYARGVARALDPIRDACTTNKEAWAKVATQALLFENRAATIRQGRVCALWRLALDKELKAATAAGQSKGKAAGLNYFRTHASAALDGAHHYCAEDSTSDLVDANVGLTKMLLDTMPEK
jgi:hypothetical protein